MLTIAVTDDAEKWQLIVEKHVENMKDRSLLLKLNNDLKLPTFFHQAGNPQATWLPIFLTRPKIHQ